MAINRGFNNTDGMFFATDGDARLFLNVETEVGRPTIDIKTTRGRSFVVTGPDAVAFAEMLRDEVVRPILETPDLKLMADGVFALPEPGGLFNVEPDPRKSKFARSVRAVVDADAQSLITLDRRGEGYAYNVTNVYSVADYAGFKPRPGSTIEITFKEISGPAEGAGQ